jgi:septum formation protein
MKDFRDIKIILASKSPRRSDLLRALGFVFEIRPADTDESYPKNLSNADVARHIAREKALAIPLHSSDEWIISADTIVCTGVTILGKPRGEEEAFTMLRSLSGCRHEVITGVTVRSSSTLHSFHETTLVEFQELSDEQIAYYIREYQPFDKAGAYGIQEWIGNFIERIDGSYQNVIGLPTARLYRELQKLLKDESL